MKEGRLCVLVVDDYAPSRYGFRRILNASDIDVSEAADAAGARSRLEAGGVDLAVIDVNLPDMNGMDLCRALQRDRPDLPVLLISASYRSAEQESAWRESGAGGFLEQPIEAEALLSKVRELTGTR